MTDRTKYIDWCKARALEYIAVGEYRHAITSMMADMNKRPDTEASDDLNAIAVLAWLANDQDETIKFIEDIR